jgi:hypothetical protein
MVTFKDTLLIDTGKDDPIKCVHNLRDYFSGSSNTWVGAGKSYKRTSTSHDTGESVVSPIKLIVVVGYWLIDVFTVCILWFRIVFWGRMSVSEVTIFFINKRLIGQVSY